MKTKVCFKCGKTKKLTEFYRQKTMADGHLGKCKDCTRADVDNRRKYLTENDTAWVEKEAERQRQKERKRYFEERKGTKKLKKQRKGSGRRYYLKYPEKRVARQCAEIISCPKGSHRHHWSYKVQHYEDVFVLIRTDHYFLHRYLKYDQGWFCYRTRDGRLLDTRKKHEEYMTKILQLRAD